MNDAARFERGQRAALAMKEFLGPAFEIVHVEYMERLAQIAAKEPWETGRISKLAIAARVAREVEAQIKALVADGEAAKAVLDRARQIERIPTEKRRILGISIPQ